MIRFNCDYSEGAHERILRKLAETNLEQTPGYGEDSYCLEAAGIIRELCRKEEAAVHFLVGGTQANQTVIAAALRPHQGVVAAVTGHINAHETGAIEATGHKVLALPSDDGKVRAGQVEELYTAHVEDDSFEHMVQPKMVYISNPTELGTIYTKKELEELYEVCRRHGLYLFVDGARLGYGLAAEGNDVDLPVLASNCDVFYIGGTKVGALFGEAVVITNKELMPDFRYHIKQRGGMLAKGRLLGLQFGELLRDGLYFELGAHADRLAARIRRACEEKGYPFLVSNTTNQIFPIMPDSVLEQWKDKYSYTHQGRVDESHTAIRLCTSWITSEEHVDALVKDILNS
ncbi:MAG: aminotransferase class I/II-fold pyridoxal phosphate-dependent enzyme [Clostridium sp.]|nr:aminotransferase class I/II-fold pyridoxal phosphate-dependent enzyme [Clostridium sp.]